ncbi:PAS domain-containing sensor histidine kinase [Spirosoma foliorum]|uniref:histidine kinase n=1 Tax=Spirosoma foliorum TaxID=2710596 RepID=A0A7G5GYB1_9BACT|nr:PAS domain-containing protein [Spirosoma foliorum]QMW03853.1 PAS domain-containing protein [Spirosoma foliorum]
MKHYPFLQASGEMGELTRNFDWSTTVLGSPDQWSQSLRTIVSVILTSKFPMFLWWGPELIQFYNDAYRPSLGNAGKHPTALGQPGADCWPETWPTIKPLIDQVLAGGEATWSEDQLIPIYRNGRLEDVYWTFSYSPVNDESGRPAGVLVTCSETTEKVTTIRDLQEHKDQLEFTIEAAELGTWDLNPLTNKFTANSRLKSWFGLLPEEEILLPKAIESIAEKDRPRVIEAIAHALDYASGGRYAIDYTIVNPLDGSERIVRAKGKAWFTDQKIAYQFKGTLQDITSERKAQEETVAAQQLADLAIKSAGIGLFQVDLLTGHIDYSPTYAAIITGDATKTGFTRQDFTNYVHVDDLYLRDAANQIGIETGDFYYQPRVIWDDGSVHHISVMGGLVVDETGRPVSYSGTVRDITEQEKQRQTLQEVEERFAQAQHQSDTLFRALVEEAPIATCLFVGRDMRIEVANEIMIGYWGKDSTVLGLPLSEAVPELHGQPFLAILDEVFTTGKAYEEKAARAELEVDGVLGTYYFDFTYKPLRNAAGQVYGIMDMAVDVTHQVLAQQQIEKTQRQVLSSFEQSPVGIAILSGPDLSFRMANPFYSALVGRKPDDLLGKPLLEALPELTGQGFDQLLNGVAATGVPYLAKEVAVDIVRDNQLERIYVDFTYQPQYESAQGISTLPADGVDNDYVSSILVVVTDVTQQVLARQKIEESEERYRILSAELDGQVQVRTRQLEDSIQDLKRSNDNLEKFAYIASHDLQEPLRKIQQFGDLLKTRYATPQAEEGIYLERMQSAASRMSRLIRDLLSFSRISTRRDASGPVSLSDVIKSALGDLDLRIQETDAQIVVGSLPVVLGDASQLGQLFQNLLNNALKFRQAELTPLITITAHQVALADLPPAVRPTQLTAIYHQIDVSDNGIGFEQKYIDRIFQVFQRLHGKNEFEGTGIGLAICEKVAANHGGAITAISEPGQGATFSVYLPA